MEAEAVDGLDQGRHADLRRVEDHPGLLRAEADVGPADTLEPFQGSLDRQRSRPSRHALYGEHHGRGRRHDRCDDGHEDEDRQRRNEPAAHHIPFIFAPGSVG